MDLSLLEIDPLYKLFDLKAEGLKGWKWLMNMNLQ